MNEFGVDISGNLILDGNRLSKVDFALPRGGIIGYGGIGSNDWLNRPLRADNGFLPTVRNMQAAGKPVGCYVFSYAWKTAAAQHEANAICDFLDANNVSLELPIFFDWEYDSYNKVTAAGYTVTKQLVLAMTMAFMNVVKSRGRRAGWYSNGDYCNQYYDTETREYWRSQGFIFWYAEWSSASAPSRDADCWQYAGDVPWEGWSQVDLNRVTNENFFNGGRTTIPIWLLFKIAENYDEGGVYRGEP